jgi:hypothetical protein
MENNTLTQHWLTSTDWADLAEINQASYNIAVLQRKASPIIAQCFQALLEHEWDAINGTGTIAEFEKNLYLQMATFDKLLNIDSRALAADMVELAYSFTQIAPCLSYRWRFAKVKSNMCTRYHADLNDLRLLCTYYGPGTLWLTQDNINPKALRRNLHDELVIDPSQVRHVAPFDVAILKGALHPENTAGAVLHRSPTVEEHGTARLLFRLDTELFGSLG